MSKVLFYVRYALGQLQQLSNPVADAAVVGFILKTVPGVHVPTATFVAILLGVGVVSRYVLSQLNSLVSSAKVAYVAKKAAK